MLEISYYIQIMVMEKSPLQTGEFTLRFMQMLFSGMDKINFQKDSARRPKNKSSLVRQKV